MPQFLLPIPLRKYADGHGEIAIGGASVRHSLAQLVHRCPLLEDQLFDTRGELRAFVNLFLNGDDIRLHDGLDTPVGERDTLEVLPAIAGGSGAPKSFGGWRAELQALIPTLEPLELAALQAQAQAPALVDVRSDSEWAQGHIPRALHVDRGYLEQRIEALLPDRAQPVVCCCQSGVRSMFAAETLLRLGYRNVKSLAGGLEAWKQHGLPLAVDAQLSGHQRARYLRHLSIPEVGQEGQLRLLDAKVLLIGAGGLGCPAALYLAAAGVGTLGIVDDDVVDLSNLQRQVLHRADSVGHPKTESARDTLLALNPELQVRLFPQRLDAANAAAICAGFDVIVDGSDTFSTRYLINDTAVALGLPVVHGSVYRFEGQVGVFWGGRGPCYRCLYPAAPPPELAPSCAEGGVLGVLPGVIGVLQATETLKLLLEIGEPLVGRALRYDALAGSMRTLKFRRDPACPCCGAGAAVPAPQAAESVPA